jgi:hypothetical protein
MIVSIRFSLARFAIAFALLGAFGPAGCASHAASTAAQTAASGLPVYPNATPIGSTSDSLAIYRTSDAFRTVADWYGAHMPAGTQASRNDAMSQATYAVFSPVETRTVHVEVSDGTVRITMTDVKGGPAPATGR